MAVLTADYIWRDYVTDGVSSSGFNKPLLSDIRKWGTLYEQSTQLNISPLIYGATGDGTTDDSANYALSEADLDSIFLPAGSVFNLDGALPTKPVFGPGAVKVNGNVFGAFEAKSYPHRSSIYQNPTTQPSTDWLYGTFPVGGGQANTIYGMGSAPGVVADGSSMAIQRTTAFGALNFQDDPQSLSRVEAFGQGALRWTRYAERVTAIGSLSMQWGGADLSRDPLGHFYQHDIAWNLGVPVTDPAWDYSGLETANPGIRAQISAWLATNPWATTSTDFARNVGVGRDSGVQKLRGTYCTYIGYRAGSLDLNTDYNSAFGADAGASNLFGHGNTSVGYSALHGNQTGDNNTAVGRQALESFIADTRNTGIGYVAGSGCFGGDNNIYVGPYSGAQDAGGGHDQRLYIQGGATGFLVGDMATGKMGIGDAMTFAMLDNANVLYLLNGSPVGGAAANVSAKTLVLEDGSSYVGMTLRSGNTFGGQIAFADPEDNNPGLIYYDHTTDMMELRAANAAQLFLNNKGVRLPNLPTSSSGLASGQLWNDGGTLKVAA